MCSMQGRSHHQYSLQGIFWNVRGGVKIYIQQPHAIFQAFLIQITQNRPSFCNIRMNLMYIMYF